MRSSQLTRLIYRNTCARWGTCSIGHNNSGGGGGGGVRNVAVNDSRQISKALFSASAPVREKENAQTDDELDKPIKFTTSKAAKWTATESLSGDPFPDSPWYQPFVVTFSVAVFLLYFLALREENDVDEQMHLSLWERIPGLEKQQLHVLLDYNRAHKLDTADIEKRLKEIESEEARQKR